MTEVERGREYVAKITYWGVRQSRLLRAPTRSAVLGDLPLCRGNCSSSSYNYPVAAQLPYTEMEWAKERLLRESAAGIAAFHGSAGAIRCVPLQQAVESE